MSLVPFIFEAYTDSLIYSNSGAGGCKFFDILSCFHMRMFANVRFQWVGMVVQPLV